MRPLSSPFEFRGEGYLGKIYRPYIQILISSKNIQEFIPLEMLLDTGADYTLLPARHADLLGINPAKECKHDTTRGVGGSEKIFLCRNLIIIKIGDFRKTIPVGFLERNDIPPLFGRLGAIELLSLTMKNRITILEEL